MPKRYNPDNTNQQSVEPSPAVTPELAQALSDQMAQLLQMIQAGKMPVVPGTPVAPLKQTAKDQGVSYEDFCTKKNPRIPRPFKRVIQPGTFIHEMRMVRQLQAEDVPTDPPDWDRFMDWVNLHPKGMAGLDNHRRAYVRLSQYHSIPVPEFALARWDDKQSVEEGRRERILRQRIRHFQNGPLDVLKLLQAKPFKKKVLNDMFHHAVTTCCLTGPRAGEPRYVEVADVDTDKMKFLKWWQPKKRCYRYNLFIPERWYWDGPGPTVNNYLTYTRPNIQPSAETSFYFYNTQNLGFETDKAWAQWMQMAIYDSRLGYAIGPHAFRRFCATVRYVYGWSLEQVADLLDDSTAVVDRSYIDKSFVQLVGRRNLGRRDPNSLPAIPPLWNIPEDLGLA